MKNYRLGRLLSDAWRLTRESYLAWASVTAVFAVVYWLIDRFNFGLLDLRDFTSRNVFEVMNRLLLMQTFAYLFLKKYFLILIRQPEVVKANFLQALKFTFTDGFRKRWKYLLWYVLTHMVLFGLLVLVSLLALYYLNKVDLFSAFSVRKSLELLSQPPPWLISVFYAVLFFFQADLFMVPYIIQDTLSEDNELIPLTYPACIRNSIRLMKRQKRKYLALTVLAFAVEFTYANVVSVIVQTLIWSPLSFLAGGFLLLITFLKFITADTFLVAANACLADVLLVEEWQIAFFGGENE